ncbi:MAG: hypothetical protein AVDCRST_MAG49-1114, partial [uncultured Thermomicrobiales bacterium]
GRERRAPARRGGPRRRGGTPRGGHARGTPEGRGIRAVASRPNSPGRPPHRRPPEPADRRGAAAGRAGRRDGPPCVLRHLPEGVDRTPVHSLAAPGTSRTTATPILCPGAGARGGRTPGDRVGLARAAGAAAAGNAGGDRGGRPGPGRGHRRRRAGRPLPLDPDRARERGPGGDRPPALRPPGDTGSGRPRRRGRRHGGGARNGSRSPHVSWAGGGDGRHRDPRGRRTCGPVVWGRGHAGSGG